MTTRDVDSSRSPAVARAVALLAAVAACTGCGSSVVVGGSDDGPTGESSSELRGDTRVGAMRGGDVVILDAEGGIATAWTQDTFFSPIRVRIGPDGSAVGFGARRYQYDYDYDAIVGGVGSAKPIPGAAPMGDVTPLGDGAVAWRDRGGDVRITDAAGNPRAGDGVVRISDLDVEVGPRGEALYFPWNDEGVMRLDLTDGTTRQLGRSAFGPIDVSPRGDIVGVAGPGEVTRIDANGDERVVCRFPSYDDGCEFKAPEDGRYCFYQPQRPQVSPDGTRVVFTARRDVGQAEGSGIFVCDVGGSGRPVRIGDRGRVGSSPVFDATGERVLYLNADGFVALGVDGQSAPELLVEDDTLSGRIDVAWLR